VAISKGNYPLTVGKLPVEDGRWVTEYSRNGHPVCHWERSVPRLGDDFLESAVYVYDSPQSAEDGERAGGSGFVVGRRLRSDPTQSFAVIVTNRHVIEKCEQRGQRPTVRITDMNGKADIIETRVKDWFLFENSYDIAAYCGGVNAYRHRIALIPYEILLTKEQARKLEIGVGDEVFMVGRFISHDGKQSNMPSVRFGSISIMPIEPISSADGTLQESYVVECRSIGGFSGSPVFVYMSRGLARGARYKMPEQIGPWLLGVNWCHLNYSERVRVIDESTGNVSYRIEEMHSGMAGVIPSWRLLELLESEPIMKLYEAQDKRIAAEKKAKSEPVVAVLDSSSQDEFTKQDFEDALKKVSRKIGTKE
jgi:hypothetical protein